MPRDADFDSDVPLPRGLTTAAIKRTIEYIERELADFVDLYFEQANLFSALVSIYAIRGLNQFSVYERHRHADIAQQRFPDLKRKGSKDPPPPKDSLECKASKRIWELQSHYDHPGWYIVWRYLVDPTCSLQRRRPVIVWRVDVVFLSKTDWKYEGSKAGSGGGGRTHTFGLRKARARLKESAAYLRSDVVLRGGKALPKNGH